MCVIKWNQWASTCMGKEWDSIIHITYCPYILLTLYVVISILLHSSSSIRSINCMLSLYLLSRLCSVWCMLHWSSNIIFSISLSSYYVCCLMFHPSSSLLWSLFLLIWILLLMNTYETQRPNAVYIIKQFNLCEYVAALQIANERTKLIKIPLESRRSSLIKLKYLKLEREREGRVCG